MRLDYIINKDNMTFIYTYWIKILSSNYFASDYETLMFTQRVQYDCYLSTIYFQCHDAR